MGLGFMLLDTSEPTKHIKARQARDLRWTADPVYYANADAWILSLIQRMFTVSVLHQ